MKIRLYFICVLILLFSIQSVRSEQIVVGGLDGIPLDYETQKYSVLLALSGGGARGLTTIGILRAFEEKNIEVTSPYFHKHEETFQCRTK